jgi:outer membrane protein TolC
VNIASNYFRLVTRRQSLAIRQANYLSLVLLTERTEALYAAGRLNFLEVQRSLQAQLSAESQLVNALQDYQSTLDQFKILLGMPIEEELEIVPVQLSLTLPDLDMKQAVELAMHYRLDLQTRRDQIEDNRRRVQVAENGLLPDLNLDASAQWGNVPGTPASHLSQRMFTYSAGLTLDLPVDRLSERNSYRTAIINFHRAERQFETLRDQIAIDARDALRTIQSAERDLRIQKMGIDLARRRLDYSNELLKQGKVTARDVVEAQSSLLDASDNYEQARAQLQISLLQYLQATGTLRVDPSAGALGKALDRYAGNGHEKKDLNDNKMSIAR